MEKKFDEKVFLATVKQLNAITPYLSSTPTCKRFIEVVRLHCGFSEEDMYIYLKGLIDRHVPDFMEKNFDINDWRKLYKLSAKINGGRLGEILTGSVDLFNDIKVMEEFYSLVMSVFGVDMEPYLGARMVFRIGWARMIDTLVKMADEMYGDKKEVDKVDAKGIMPDKSESVSDGMAIGHVETSLDSPDEYVCEAVEEQDSEPVEPETHVVPKVGTVIKSKKEKSGKIKRGYGIPVHQYRRVAVFDSVEAASKQTGATRSEILKCIGSRPESVVESVWRFVDKKHTKVAQYTYLHTYKNQNEIKPMSKDVCGKTVYHNNIDLKSWTPAYKGEFVWIQVAGEAGPDIHPDKKKSVSIRHAA